MTQEGQDCENYGGSGVGYDPRKIRPDIRKASCADGLLDSHRMAERQQLGHRFERAAYKIKVKPYAGQPCGEVCQQRAAYAAYLLYAQGTAAQKPERNENTEAGIIISTDHRTFTVTSRQRKNAVTKHTAACQRAMGSSGKV